MTQNKRVSTIRRFLWLILDVLLVAASLVLGLVFYFDIRPPQAHVIHTLRAIPILCLSTVAALWISGLYKTLIKYASVDLLWQIVFATLAGTGITYLISLLFYLIRGDGPNIFLMPRPVYLLQWLIAVFLISWSRFAGKMHFPDRRKKQSRRILVIGAGYAGATVVRDIQSGRYGDAIPVAVLDTDQAKAGNSINRIPVVNEGILDAAERYKPDEIIIAIAQPRQELIDECIGTGLKVRIFSEARGVVRELNIADLLGRPETHLDMTEAKACFSGKKVMVTGGGGSIGSELCRQIMSFTPAQLIIYDISENYMYDLLFELREKYGSLVMNTVMLEVGSVRDEKSLRRVMEKYRPRIVIHAAAHKHVPLMEDSPCEAIKNNPIGTYKTAWAAMAHGCERFVLISTDKAVNPTNIMGCTKRLAEIYVQSLGLAVESSRVKGVTRFVTTRFGNVLGSNGSVIPRFREQIAKGGPVTVTHPDINRFFMTIPEACRLVMEAATKSTGNQIFVFDMGQPVKIDTLARRMISLAGFTPDKDIKIEYTGLRPGEKLYEEVLANDENTLPAFHERIRIAKVREYVYEDALENVMQLESLARAVEIPTMVKLMKQIVPEFKSKNSKFAAFDNQEKE